MVLVGSTKSFFGGRTSGARKFESDALYKLVCDGRKGREEPSGLRGRAAIDDSACARRLLAYHLGRHLPTARVCCFGESSGDVTPFVGKADPAMLHAVVFF